MLLQSPFVFFPVGFPTGKSRLTQLSLIHIKSTRGHLRFGSHVKICIRVHTPQAEQMLPCMKRATRLRFAPSVVQQAPQEERLPIGGTHIMPDSGEQEDHPNVQEFPPPEGSNTFCYAFQRDPPRSEVCQRCKCRYTWVPQNEGQQAHLHVVGFRIAFI